MNPAITTKLPSFADVVAEPRKSFAQKLGSAVRTIGFLLALAFCYGTIIALLVACGQTIILASEIGEGMAVLCALGLPCALPMICMKTKKSLACAAVVPGALFWVLPVCAVTYWSSGINLVQELVQYVAG